MKITKEYLTQKNTVFHAETEDEANWLLKKAHDLGLKWVTEKSFIEKNNFSHCNSGTCYNFNAGSYDELFYYEERNYTIIKIKDIMKEEKQIKITKENAIQMKESGIESLVELAKVNYPELFEQEKWNREALSVLGDDYYSIQRGANVGFEYAMSSYHNLKLSHTYPTKELAEKEAKMFNLIQEMRAFTRWANEKDDFVADWSDDKQKKQAIGVIGSNVLVINILGYRDGLFQCYFATKDRAKECLDIFEEDIKEVFELEK